MQAKTLALKSCSANQRWCNVRTKTTVPISTTGTMIPTYATGIVSDSLRSYQSYLYQYHAGSQLATVASYRTSQVPVPQDPASQLARPSQLATAVDPYCYIDLVRHSGTNKRAEPKSKQSINPNIRSTRIVIHSRSRYCQYELMSECTLLLQ